MSMIVAVPVQQQAIAIAQPSLDFSFLSPSQRAVLQAKAEHYAKLSQVLHELQTTPLLSQAYTSAYNSQAWYDRIRRKYLKSKLLEIWDKRDIHKHLLAYWDQAPYPALSYYQREKDEWFGLNRTDARWGMKLQLQLCRTYNLVFPNNPANTTDVTQDRDYKYPHKQDPHLSNVSAAGWERLKKIPNEPKMMVSY